MQFWLQEDIFHGKNGWKVEVVDADASSLGGEIFIFIIISQSGSQPQITTKFYFTKSIKKTAGTTLHYKDKIDQRMLFIAEGR